MAFKVDMSQMNKDPGGYAADFEPPKGEQVMSQKVMVFDLESGPLPGVSDMFDESTVKYGTTKDPDKKRRKLMEERAKFVSKAALDACTGEILVCGYLFNGQYIIEDMEEPEALSRFFETYRTARSKDIQMAGWHISGFDLPFIMRRSMILDVPMPSTFMSRSRNGRLNFDPIFLDLEEVWIGPNSAYGTESNVHHVAQGMGLPGKLGENGGEFAGWWKNDRPRAIRYLRRDLYREFMIGRRMRLI